MSPISRGQDTSLGGSRGEFPQTRWSLFLTGLSSGAPPDDALKRELAQRYWKPIYLFIRTRWGKAVEDAKDLTQDFFVWVFESDFLKKPDPSRGRFRAFLKVALKHYLVTEQERRRALKRGGDRAFVPLDDLMKETDLPEPGGGTPDDEMDVAWRNAVFAAAAERLERNLRDEGREIVFAVFREYHLRRQGDPGMREVGERLGLSADDVANHLRSATRRLQRIVTDLVAETVQDEEELREELKTLFGIEL